MRASNTQQPFRERADVIDKNLGTKRLCPDCHAKFYDLNRSPAKCPKCGKEFVPKPILPSKQDQMEAAQAESAKAPAELEAPEVADVAEDVEEMAAEVPEEVAEVALEEAEDVTVEPDDSAVFLEDDDTPVEKIIPTAPVDPDEEES